MTRRHFSPLHDRRVYFPPPYSNMPLERGTRLGPYQIESPIGAGGMEIETSGSYRRTEASRWTTSDGWSHSSRRRTCARVLTGGS